MFYFFSLQRVDKKKDTDGDKSSDNDDNNNEEEEEEEEEGEEYIVESVLDSRVEDGQTMYLLKWKGYPE